VHHTAAISAAAVAADSRMIRTAAQSLSRSLLAPPPALAPAPAPALACARRQRARVNGPRAKRWDLGTPLERGGTGNIWGGNNLNCAKREFLRFIV
jgi:hypothetical protein